ncbi:DUF6037 family protein [Oribacterium sp. P6A1]|uniref:DUF6037 family protein n=1 Tax=Oribacterium sp. P6A1 TaxID=1410612 RepID=UPI000689BF60|nr:DUF6037 family protein [Oribacterium sp. P6A1]
MSKLKLPNLVDLVEDMSKNEIEKEHFMFEYAKQTIDCKFCIKPDGGELLIGVHRLNFGLALDVYINRSEEYIAELTDKDYIRFCKALNLTYHGDGFTSNTLLELISRHIPKSSACVKIEYCVMREYTKCRHVDEAEKIYFKGWNDHVKDGKEARNYDKTEFYFGNRVANYCREHNISSIWTDIPLDEKAYANPWLSM